MSALRRLCWVLPLALLLPGAAPLPHVEELVRRGNAAFKREEYEAALRHYRGAEEATTDPGLVAFNEAAALYRLGRHREAELHYRRSLEGADGPRRARALYDLGNCLLHQGQGRDVGLLQEAVRCYEACRDCTAAPSLRADARHNLELARLLWFKALKEAPQRPDDGGESGKDNKESPKEEPGGATSDQPSGQHKQRGKQGPDGAEKASATSQPMPGRGNLRTIPDSDDLVPLAPEDTAAYVDRVAARVARERRAAWQTHPAPARNVKDW